MPSFTKNLRKKKQDVRPTELSAMAGNGRYRKVDKDYPAASTTASTVIRNVTTQRKSDQVKNNRSQSVPSLNSASSVIKQSPSPSRQQRSNSVRASNSVKKFSFRRRIAKIFGSHSDLSKPISHHNQTTTDGIYRPLGSEYRTRSTGGSSDCSSSSLTSAHQQEFSRHNSLRDSSRSRISQTSVFSSRQASCDSSDILNFTVHGPTVPSESNLRPRSIACIQHFGSSSSLKNNSTIHAISDTRFYSLAAPSSSRVEIGDSLVHSMDERTLTRVGGPHRYRGNYPIASHEEFEHEEVDTIKPSHPEYKKVATNLMNYAPPTLNEDHHHSQLDQSSDHHIRKTSTEMIEDLLAIHIKGSQRSSSPLAHYQRRLHNLSDDKRSQTPDAALIHTSLPNGWETAYTSTGLRYFINHINQTTHWNLPTDGSDDSDLPSGWELVKSKRYGTYFVNHNNCTAQYQHPVHSTAPPPYHMATIHGEEDEKDRKTPLRSHSHRNSNHRIFDPNSSLPRRSKSFRNESIDTTESSRENLHTRQLSTMTYVPPSPYQIAEIPHWLKDYVDAPFGSDRDKIQWLLYSQEDLSGLDTMIKRLFKKSSEQLVKKFDYHRVALQQEIEQRHRQEQAMKLQMDRPHHHRKPPTTTIPYHHHQSHHTIYSHHPPSAAPTSHYNPHLYPSNGLIAHRSPHNYHSPSNNPITANTITIQSTDVYNGSDETFV